MKSCLSAAVLFAMLTMNTTARGDEHEDPWLWLEDIEGEQALAWVEERNAESLAELEAHPGYERLFKKNLEVYDSQARIPTPAIRGGYVFNFWRDAEHERGLWRRTPIGEYRKQHPEWEVLIDLDALAEAEGENWIWDSASCLEPGHERCLVSLSRGGADATVIREFDVPSRSFVEGGFYLPEAKGFASYLDRDRIFVSTDFGPGTMTDSGYPRTTRLWTRGTPLAEAELLFEGEQTDIGVYSTRLYTPEGDYSMVVLFPTFFTRETHLYRAGGLHRLDVPPDAEIETIFRNQILLSLKSDWSVDGETFAQGALVSVDLDDLLAGEGRPVTVLAPDARSAISEVARTRDVVLVNRMTDVRNRLDAYTFADGEWRARPVEAPDMGQISIVSTSDESNLFYFDYTDFLTPTSLYEAEGVGEPEVIKTLPAFFDASPYEASQHFVHSADGTRVPYFMVARKDLETDSRNPTLIYAYGGFEVAQQPSYSATIGMDWLDAGGVYVLANIRGGGEYGPAWHRAAMRENRQKSYDDVYAVAEDLIARNITAPDHLGIRGGSGGGLLVGMLFTQRPELFNAVVCQVPLLDMKRYDKLLAGASWVEEYGDPDDPDDWAFLKNYSPYHNLDEDTDYPRVFFTTSTRDDRVHPGHARKMVARMLAMGKPVLYYENTEGGHGGAANNRQQAKVQALIYTYLMNELTKKQGSESDDSDP